MIKIYAVIATTTILALLGGVWYGTTKGTQNAFAACSQNTIAGGVGAIGGAFTLVDHTGATVTDKDVITEPSILYFGYTFCPDICPADNARNAVAVDILAEQGYDVTPVMISIDPERDTPEVMADFTFNLHERMIGLTGTPEQVKAASQAYKTFYQKQDGDEEFYLVDHSTFSYLVLPDLGVVEFFRREVTPEQMAEQTACFIDTAEEIDQ